MIVHNLTGRLFKVGASSLRLLLKLREKEETINDKEHRVAETPAPPPTVSPAEVFCETQCFMPAKRVWH